MLRIGALRLLAAWGVSVAFSACGGRTADTEQSIESTGGTPGPSTITTMADAPSSVGGSSSTLASAQSGGFQSFGGNTTAVLTTLTGGTFGAGGVPSNIGGATLIAVGGTLCALAYNGQTYTTLVSQQLCGNGELEYSNGEQCDDGNRISGDGCSNACRLESNYPCGDGCRPCTRIIVCGDGVLAGGEQCDDANSVPGDGCNAICLIEPNWTCPTPGKPCVKLPICGDGILQSGEECDEGVNNGSDICGYCTSSCTLGPYCGDGIVQGYCGEACDNGTSNNDGAYGHCAPNCAIPSPCNEQILYLDGGVILRSGCV